MANIMIKRIKQLMQKKDITIRELAKKIGVTEIRMALYMIGNRPISVDDLVKIAKALNTTTDYLVGLGELEEYRIAFDLLLKDDCLNDKSWLGTLDELYESRKEYYLNKAKEVIKTDGVE